MLVQPLPRMAAGAAALLCGVHRSDALVQIKLTVKSNGKRRAGT
jgi:hypothetical protein